MGGTCIWILERAKFNMAKIIVLGTREPKRKSVFEKPRLWWEDCAKSDDDIADFV